MEEAEELCDRVAIIDHGKIVALDSPRKLVASLDAENRIVFSVDGPVDDAPFRTILGVTRVEQSGGRIIIFGREDGLLVRVVMALDSAKIRFRDLRTEQPSLEDVFLALTGKEMRD
jgi:ABC-2 type transport system ATP-binding protein